MGIFCVDFIVNYEVQVLHFEYLIDIIINLCLRRLESEIGYFFFMTLKSREWLIDVIKTNHNKLNISC